MAFCHNSAKDIVFLLFRQEIALQQKRPPCILARNQLTYFLPCTPIVLLLHTGEGKTDDRICPLHLSVLMIRIRELIPIRGFVLPDREVLE